MQGTKPSKKPFFVNIGSFGSENITASKSNLMKNKGEDRIKFAERLLQQLMNRDYTPEDIHLINEWIIYSQELNPNYELGYHGNLVNGQKFVWTMSSGTISTPILEFIEASRSLPYFLRKFLSVPVAFMATMKQFGKEFPKIEVDGRIEETVDTLFVTNYPALATMDIGENHESSYLVKIGLNPSQAGRSEIIRRAIFYAQKKIVAGYFGTKYDLPKGIIDIERVSSENRIKFHVPNDMKINVDSLPRKPAVVSPSESGSSKLSLLQTPTGKIYVYRPKK